MFGITKEILILVKEFTENKYKRLQKAIVYIKKTT